MIKQKPDVLFHHFQSTSNQDYLLYVCKLVEKGFKENFKPIYIQTKNHKQAEQLDKLLWTFRQESFIPHAILNDSETLTAPVQIGWHKNSLDAAEAIINLSENIPNANISTKKIHEIVDADGILKEKARERWKHYKTEGFDLKVHHIK